MPLILNSNFYRILLCISQPFNTKIDPGQKWHLPFTLIKYELFVMIPQTHLELLELNIVLNKKQSVLDNNSNTQKK